MDKWRHDELTLENLSVRMSRCFGYSSCKAGRRTITCLKLCLLLLLLLRRPHHLQDSDFFVFFMYLFFFNCKLHCRTQTNVDWSSLLLYIPIIVPILENTPCFKVGCLREKSEGISMLCNCGKLQSL